VFSEKDPAGFGLMVRDRDFDHFQDLEAQYHRRPGVWVETLGSWGSGAIYLIEIPSDAEKYDNIVAYWSPSQNTNEAKELAYDYRLHFVSDEFTAPGSGKVQATRIGSAGAGSNRRQFVVDFGSPTMKRLSAKAKIDAEISSSTGRILNPVIHKNEEVGTWRLSFELDPENEKDLVELRALLRSGKDILTETWVYQWNVR
jgi:glucans biosynthesis protein